MESAVLAERYFQRDRRYRAGMIMIISSTGLGNNTVFIFTFLLLFNFWLHENVLKIVREKVTQNQRYRQRENPTEGEK